ncbi:Pimeloyl-ACP methyl ester carboxylesterase [Amycolatopsis saalfeldensis]|uniref:Pimeloyl-ACP methyl ester carboxylesterase n=1 Tax=Amycolatopsis saalfeldensis TaxID=394193 RepID=A0A1H8YPS8_9PSEU|nr:Pimeloyl-ACP methyl ester carboxylesterase [Amycolatopsis saalfeldensis]
MALPEPGTGTHRRGRHRAVRRTFGTAVAGLLAAVATILAGPGPSASAASQIRSCTELDIPVTSGLLAETMHATLCPPAGSHVGAPLQVLVAGGTYNRNYWSGLGLDAYSYSARANAAGFATLAVDRIGTGASSHPLSILVTAGVQAEALHQVVARARSGALDGQQHDQVALVGHSLGSMASVIAAARHPHDVDAVILTGYSHRIAPDQLLTSLTSMHPAALEGHALDPGYLTTVPGVRAGLFHAADDVDPAILAADEATKDAASATELPDGALLGLTPATSRAITAPVLEANGGQDAWACTAVDCTSADTLRAAEQPNFTAPLTTYVQAKSGHCLALATDGDQFADYASEWLHHVLVAGVGGSRS